MYEFFFAPKITPKPKNRSLFITALHTILQNASATGYNYLSSSFAKSKFANLLSSAKASLVSIGGEVGEILGDFVSFIYDLNVLIVKQLRQVAGNFKLFTWFVTMISIPLVAFIKLASLQNMAFRGTFALLAYNIVVECLVLMNIVLNSAGQKVSEIKGSLKQLFSKLLTRATNRLNYLVKSTQVLAHLPANYILSRTNRTNQQLVSLVDDPEINRVIGPVLSGATKKTAKELYNIVVEYFRLIGTSIPPEPIENIARVQSPTQPPTNSSASAQSPRNTTIGQLSERRGAAEEVQPLQNPSASAQNTTIGQLYAENSSSSQKSGSESDDNMNEELQAMLMEPRTDRERAKRPQGPPKPNSTEATPQESDARKPQRRPKLKSGGGGNSVATAGRKPTVSKTPPRKLTRSSSRLKNSD